MSTRSIACCALLFLSSTSAAASFERAPDEPRRVRRLLVAVGIDEFEHELPAGSQDDRLGWRRLTFAQKDARDISAAFVEYGFEAYGSPLLGETATSTAVFGRLLDLFEEVRADDAIFEIVIYFSTHGFEISTVENSETYLAMFDTPPWDSAKLAADLDRDPEFAQKRRAIALRDLLALIRSFGENVHRSAVIIDACYVPGGKIGEPGGVWKGSGSDDKPTESDLVASRKIAKSLRRGNFVLSAVGPRQQAWEDHERKNSLYTHFLVRALSSQPEKSEARALLPGFPFSLFAAHQWAAERVEQIRGEQQTPSWSAPVLNEGKGLFFLEPAGEETAALSPVIIVEPPHDTLVSVQWAGSGVFKGGERMISRYGSAALPAAGAYSIRIRSEDGDLELEREVDLKDGQVHVVSPLIELRARPWHQWSFGVGWEGRRDAWGEASGIADQPFAFARYGLSGWPWSQTEGALRASFGISDALGGDRFSRATDFSGAIAAEILTGTNFGIVALRAGPRIGIAAVRREVEEVQASEWRTAVRGGLAGRVSVPVSSHFDLALGLAAETNVFGAGAQGLWSAEATIGFGFGWASHIAGDIHD